MSQQAMPFFDSDKSATKYAVQASGMKPKEVAAQLWPGKGVERALADFNAALNENRADALSSDEHVRVALITGRHDWLYYICSRLNHTRPTLVTPAEMSAQLQREIFETTAQFKSLIGRMEQLQAQLQGGAK